MLLLVVCHQRVPIRVLGALRMPWLLAGQWLLHVGVGKAAAERVQVFHIHGAVCGCGCGARETLAKGHSDGRRLVSQLDRGRYDNEHFERRGKAVSFFLGPQEAERYMLSLACTERATEVRARQDVRTAAA